MARTYTIVETSSMGDPRTHLSGVNIIEVDEAYLRQQFAGSEQLQTTFGSANTYVEFMGEQQDLIDLGLIDVPDWHNAEPITGTAAQEARGNDDLGTGGGMEVDYQPQSQTNAQDSAYRQWIMNPEYQALLSDYGVSDRIFNDDGDSFRWTGGGYQKVSEVDDSFDTMAFAEGVLTSIAAAVVTGGIAANLAPTLSATLGVSQQTAANMVSAIGQVARDGELNTTNVLYAASSVLGSGQSVMASCAAPSTSPVTTLCGSKSSNSPGAKPSTLLAAYKALVVLSSPSLATWPIALTMFAAVCCDTPSVAERVGARLAAMPPVTAAAAIDVSTPSANAIVSKPSSTSVTF